MNCTICGRTGFETGGKLASHLVMVHGVSSGEAALRAAQMSQDQKEAGESPAPPVPPPPIRDASPYSWRTYPKRDPKPEPSAIDEGAMRAATRPCGCPRLGRHLKLCKESAFYTGTNTAAANTASATTDLKDLKLRVASLPQEKKPKPPKKKSRKPLAKAVSRKKVRAVMPVLANGNGSKPHSDEAVRLLRLRLNEEKLDLEAQLKVIDRLLASTGAPV